MNLIRGFKPKETGFGEEYNAHLAKRTRIGEWFLLRHIIPNTVRKLRGPTIDFGCGIGDILARAPAGSIGLELNKASVEYCTKRGLEVRPYDPATDRYELRDVEPDRYGTLLMSHVLEHIPDTAHVLRTILTSSHRLGIGRVVIKVPGALMYSKDDTHVTFVDRAWLRANDLVRAGGFEVTEISYYPFNAEWIGKYSLVHETLIVYDRVP